MLKKMLVCLYFFLTRYFTIYMFCNHIINCPPKPLQTKKAKMRQLFCSLYILVKFISLKNKIFFSLLELSIHFLPIVQSTLQCP